MTDTNKLIEEETISYDERTKLKTRLTSNECTTANGGFQERCKHNW